MIIIDPDKWYRKKHFDFFKNMEFPYFNICLNLDITKLYNYCKNNDISIFLASTYLILKAANKTEYLRLRIINDKIYVFDIVHPGHVRYLDFARQQGDLLVVGWGSTWGAIEEAVDRDPKKEAAVAHPANPSPMNVTRELRASKNISTKET